MQQFRVKAPQGIERNQIVTVNAAGEQFCVRIPEDVNSGDNFFFSLTAKQIADAKKRKPDDKIPILEGSKEFVNQPLMFHDYTDLGMALCLGFTIGGAIVLGFVCGVLYITA